MKISFHTTMYTDSKQYTAPSHLREKHLKIRVVLHLPPPPRSVRELYAAVRLPAALHRKEMFPPGRPPRCVHHFCLRNSVCGTNGSFDVGGSDSTALCTHSRRQSSCVMGLSLDQDWTSTEGDSWSKRSTQLTRTPLFSLCHGLRGCWVDARWQGGSN